MTLFPYTTLFRSIVKPVKSEVKPTSVDTKIELNYFVVDVFTDKPFGGNPAGVCLLDSWLPDELLHKEAEQMVSNSLINTRKFRALTMSALFGVGMGRASYAHFCRYEHDLT
jgi:hypothetical protein